MKKFMDENFLLETETAKKLFFEVAKDLPIYDYHCHLSPEEIYEDKQFKNITEVWLGGDHYRKSKSQAAPLTTTSFWPMQRPFSLRRATRFTTGRT